MLEQEAAAAAQRKLQIALCAAAGLILAALAAFLIFARNRRTKARAAAGAVLLLILLSPFLIRSFTDGEIQENAPPAETIAPVPAVSSAPVIAPSPTPEPLRELTLRGTGSEEVFALLEIPTLTYVDATASRCYAELAEVSRKMPDCVVDYTVDIGGVPVSSTQNSVVLEDIRIEPEALAEALYLLPRLQTADICALGYTNEEALRVVSACPDVKIVWQVHFARWSVRSDITCFSTLCTFPIVYRYTNEDLAPLLLYCKDLVALDLGHNAISDLTPIGEMKGLKVLILGDNPTITDLSPLGNLSELEYLEFFMNDSVTDYACMERLNKMRDLCLGYCHGLRDISFVSAMPALEMAWFPGDGFSDEQQAEAQAACPNARFLFNPSRVSSTSDGWRATERNVEIRRAFSNWTDVIAFRSWDDVEYREGASLVAVYPAEN